MLSQLKPKHPKDSYTAASPHQCPPNTPSCARLLCAATPRGAVTLAGAVGVALALAIASPSAHAMGNLVGHSQALSSGQSSNHFALFNGINNPAMGELMIAPDERFRLNYFFSLSSSTELGQVDNFVDDIDELIDILDDPNNAQEDGVNETLDRFNRVIKQAGEDGYVKTTIGSYLPPLPLYWRPQFLPGTLMFELNVESQVNLSVLADTLIYDEVKTTFTTSTSAYLKSGLQKKIAIGYSQVFGENLWGTSDTQLILGAKFNIYDLELSKQVFQLELLDGQDIEDVIADEYKNNRINSTSIGLDFGAVWTAPRYRLGASLSNLNAPSFDYGAIGVNCDQYPEGSDAQSNCYIANYFSTEKGEIKTYETHKKNPVITVDGSYFVLENWLVSGSLNLASYDDPVGQESQWFAASTSYHPTGYWLPGMRATYSKNLAGSKLDYLGLGLTFGKVFNLDFNVALDEIQVDGDKAPRGFGIALSFEEPFNL
ncbi:MAG TPA: conjugal transfer protein TraF [Marinagarivorans sp.]